jgi:PAS domain S-box-containing protein
MKLFKRITETGIGFTAINSEKRNIILTNSISLLAVAATILLLTLRGIFAYVNANVLFTLVPACFFFLLPIFMNRVGLYNLSRLFLCWFPALFQLYASLRTMNEVAVFESSTYVGLRFFNLAFCCFPFLVFDIVKNKYLFLFAFFGPTFCVLMYDPFLSLFGVGYRQVGLNDASYEFNNARVAVGLSIIAGSCYMLKRLVERNEIVNEHLIAELEEKNAIIQRQSEDQLVKLNRQLSENLQRLGEREYMLNQSQRIAKVGSWDYRKESKIIYWSDEMYNIFGVDRNFDLQNELINQVLWGEESELFEQAMNNILQTGESFDVTVRAKTPLGYQKWIRVCAFPTNDENGISGVRGICHDVTFYKEAEERLRASEEKFYKAFNSNPDLITIIRESDFAIIDANEKLFELLGYERESVLGKPATSLNLFIHDGDRKYFFDNYFREGRMTFEGPWRRRDGSIIHVIISSIRIQISGDFYLMSVIKDITDRKIAEEKFTKAFDLSPDLMIIFRESDMVVVETNKRIERVSGFRREEIIGFNAAQKDLQIWANPEDRQIFFNEYNESGSAFQEPQLKRKNGEVFFATVSAQRIVLAGQNHMIVVVRDVTDRKKAQRELILSQANLNATINNIEIMIWSVDRSFNLMTYNKAFFDYVKGTYGIEVQRGKRIMDTLRTPESAEMTKKWSEIYMRALSGEAMSLEETRFGKDFKYSISPIIEDTRVIGASIVADNVTERNTRNRELADAQRKIGELKLMALRSVMNPHFIFNVLNSIQYFIAKNDRLNAINYLSTFSKLIRSILTHSVNNKIKLSEEIELLRNYVNLEMTRFENKFSFNLNIDDNVEVDNIEIPSLLIQPFVENAILHGLYNKTSPGQLTINIREKNEVVCFEIIDDGIGREAAIKLKQQNFSIHKSMGIKITEDRLKILNEHHNVDFETIDLVDASGPCGTKVVIGVKF